jgi:multidrug efflux pump
VKLPIALIHRPIGISLLAAGLFLAGLICYLRLGVSALPNVEVPVIYVQASQPGADASTMATTVTAVLERRLGQVPGIEAMRSTSADGSSIVYLIFQDGVGIDSAALDVQAAINAAQADLPAGMDPPSFQKANPNDDPVLAIALTSQTQSADQLYRMADDVLAQQLRRINGVSTVDVAGASSPAIRVDVDLRSMNAKGITPDDVRNAVRAANVTMPTGFLFQGNTATAILVNDSVSKAADVARLVISRTSDGGIVRLGEIANVHDGQRNAYQGAWLDGKPSVIMYVYLRAGANMVATVDAVKAAVPGLREELSAGTTLTPYFDRTPTTRSSLHEVEVTLLISLIMVVLTMALFLRRMAPTLIAASTAPLSLAGAAIVMYVLGFTLNNLSLLALVIAIGFVVDDAIVVIENIMRHLDAGKPPLQAALLGTREIGFTVISITASLVAVFAPLLFAGGRVGVFMHEFTVSLVAAIMISMLVSLTLTPALCGRFLRVGTASCNRGWLGARAETAQRRMLDLYAVSLDFSLRHALLLALTPLLLIVLTFGLLMLTKKGSFPLQDSGLISGSASSSATISFSDLARRQQVTTRMLMADPAVKRVGTQMGSSRQGPNVAFNIELKSRSEGRRQTTHEVLSRLSAKAQGYAGLDLRLRAVQDLPSGGSGNRGAQYRISLLGNDLAELQRWLPRLVAELKKNPKLRDVGSDVDGSSLQQNIMIDRAKAARLGISVGDVNGALYGAFGQRQISSLYSGLSEYGIVVNALPSQMAGPEALDEIQLPTRDGTMVPLRAIERQVPGLAQQQITHENQFNAMALSYDVAPGVSEAEATGIIDAAVRELRMPGNIRISDGGAFKVHLNPNSMAVLLIAAILAVYIVLGMLYESLIHPVTILSTLPAAGMGAMLALLVTGSEFSFMSMIALILLVGIVKKNAIMMIDFTLVAQRERGLAPHEAVREACLVRFRPIMMTTMIAILAALPLAIGVGDGSDLQRPLGIAIVGGLLVSQALTLLSTPALYVIFSCLAQRWDARRAASESTPQLPAPA